MIIRSHSILGSEEISSISMGHAYLCFISYQEKQHHLFSVRMVRKRAWIPVLQCICCVNLGKSLNYLCSVFSSVKWGLITVIPHKVVGRVMHKVYRTVPDSSSQYQLSMIITVRKRKGKRAKWLHSVLGIRNSDISFQWKSKRQNNGATNISTLLLSWAV